MSDGGAHEGSPQPSWGHTVGMPEVSVYLPDDLYDAVRAHDLPLSHLAQDAIRAALARRSSADWVAAVRARPRRGTHPSSITTAELMDGVGEEFGA